MTKKKGGLGNKGVEVLLSSSTSNKIPVEKTSLNINVSSIKVSPYQPRVNFDEDNLKSLVESIREQGVIQPILVRKASKNKFELIRPKGLQKLWFLFLLDDISASLAEVNTKSNGN